MYRTRARFRLLSLIAALGVIAVGCGSAEEPPAEPAAAEDVEAPAGSDQDGEEEPADAEEPAPPEETDAVAEFYEGETITIIVGGGQGGGYDQYARLIADHWSRHIPGAPNILVDYREGAQGMVAFNYAATAAPQDGTEVFLAHHNTYLHQLREADEVAYDLREMRWIGTPVQDGAVCVARKDSGIETFDQLFEEELMVATGSPAEETVLAELLGVNFNVVAGYEGGDGINLAIEQGEVGGRCPWSWSSVVTADAEFVDELNFFVQLGVERHPDVPEDIPFIMDYVDDETSRQVLEILFAGSALGRPLNLPPGVPDDRVDALRAAFDALMEDPEFIADAEDRGLEIIPADGATLDDLTTRILDGPREPVDRLDEILG